MSREITSDDGKLPNIWGEESEKLPEYLLQELAENTMESKWENVVKMCKNCPGAHTARINGTKDTVLHMAIDLNEEKAARELVDAILEHEKIFEREGGPIKWEKTALGLKNERGDTPLHIAASRGFAKICKCIVGDNKERIYLVHLKNNEGETPLFLAALIWNKQAFAYLFRISRDRITVDDLIREDRDSILHCAIRTECFDLAVIIVHYYDSLTTISNKYGDTPLKLLATRPSAFGSGIKLSWWKLILYHCILVEPLDPDSKMEKILRKMEQPPTGGKFPGNYATLYDFFSNFLRVVAPFESLKTPSDGGQENKKNQKKGMTKRGKLPLWINDELKHDAENSSKSLEKHEAGFLPPNYATIRQFIRSAYMNALGLSGVAPLKDVKKTKKKHQWSGQLLKALMARPYAAFTGSGGLPTDLDVELDMYNVIRQSNQGETSSLETSLEKPSSKPSVAVADSGKETSSRKDSKEDTIVGGKKTPSQKDPKETPFLVSAKNGIVELVDEIQSKIPSAIYDTNSKKQNVLLVAVINRQPRVIETLRIRLRPEVWINLILASDDEKNTMLHLAAQAAGKDKSWRITGSALQMMWDIKWFQYIMSIVPRRFYFISNDNSETAWQIFKNSHDDLIEKGREWLKDTSESCSVVAALVAGVSFATASTVPGGTNDEGKAPLQGQPAFDAFAIASLIGLCFSVTGLIMFLSILTSRKEAKDFRRDLPLKLLLGLSSLFLSIIAMFVSFCSGHFFIINHKYNNFLFPFYAAASIPVTFYASAQFPLYFDLLRAIITKVPQASDASESF